MNQFEYLRQFCDENDLISLHIFCTGGTGTHKGSCYNSECGCRLYKRDPERLTCATPDCPNDLCKMKCVICKLEFCPKCLFSTLEKHRDWQCQTCLYSPGGIMFAKCQQRINEMIR